MNLYVGNLSYDVTEDDLRSVFGEHGEVSSAKIISDRMTGRSKGFGFVEMPNDDEGQSAIDALNDLEYQGRNMRVSVARPREDRPRRPRF
ncbi:MAG: RNA recognition motif domain-containing protein [Fidelibacterota bacterium]